MASSNHESSFTFLNYDTPNHNASHRKTVKSHISSKYRTAVRQQAEPRYALPRRLSSQQSSPGAQLDNPPTATQKRKKDAVSTLPDGSAGVIWKPSPREVSFRGIRVDPFKSFPGQQTPCVINALDYYTQAISPLMEPLLMAINMVNPLMVWMYPLILSEESAYHGAVALSQAYFEKRQDPTARPSSEVLFHRRKAAITLRERLSDLRSPPNDGALMTVLALAALDVVYGDDRLANRKGLALIVALKGGLESLGHRGLVKAFLVQFDYFWMLETGSPTLFPFRKRKNKRFYPRPPFSSEIQSMIASLPPGFAAIARQGFLGADVLQILSRVSRFLGSKVANTTISMGEEPLADGQGYPDLFDACACLQSSLSTEHSLEKNLILAIILFSFDVHVPNGSMSKVAAYRGSRQELTRSLPLTSGRNRDERSCLIWIWMIVIRSWKSDLLWEDRVSSLGRQFFERFGEATSWDVVEGYMRQFFWYEPLAEGLRSSWLQSLDKFLAADKPDWEVLAPGTDQRQRVTYHLNRTGRGKAEQGVSGGRPEEQNEQPHYGAILPPMLTLDTYLGQIQ